MKLIIERSFGTIEVENSDSKELIKEASFWQELPNECAKCGAGVRLFFRSPQDNDYYGLVCVGNPRHESNFGQFKKGGLYYKNEWHEAYKGVVDERNAEIAKYDTVSPQRGNLLERINNATAAIKGLQGQVNNGDLSKMSDTELESLISELNDQYKRLKATRGVK